VRDAFTYLTHGPFRYKIAALWNGVERLPVASGSAGVDHIINYLFDVRLAFFCLFDRWPSLPAFLTSTYSPVMVVECWRTHSGIR
jgi:hypothetical protein